MKKHLVFIITVILSIVYVWIGYGVATKDYLAFEGASRIYTVTAKVKAITNIQREDYTFGESQTVTSTYISFVAEVKNGERRGETVTCMQHVDPFFAIQPAEVEVGDKILIMVNEDPTVAAEFIMVELVRSDSIILLGVLFCIFVIAFGRFEGVKTIISLGFTCLSVFVVFVPAVLAGQNIYMWSAITCLFITAMTLIMVYGLSEKSLAAGIGCIAGVMTSAVIVLIMVKIMRLTGMVNEESVYLKMLHSEREIDLIAIIFGAVIIGALGAIMDVSMSIASALNEMNEKIDSFTFNDLFKSGNSIGRDMVGTMANTLVLAYIGSSLSVVLLLVAYNHSLMEVFNKEMIIVEMLQTLSGSFGILLTIPLTSFVCSFLYIRANKKRKLADLQNMESQ